MIGKTLQNGKYEIKRVLGQGGFGITYEGVQTGLGRKVAIKEFFMKDFCEREAGTSMVTIVGTEGNRYLVERFKEKFIKEAQMIAGLEDVPHVIRIYDIFQENGTAYYVMQFIEGGSLDSKVKTEGALNEGTAIGYIMQIAEALEQLHAQKIMHLDIKPANILLRGKDLFLIDFGVSKHYDAEGDATTTTPVGRSKGYAPIEQYRQGGVQSFSPETDIYSLGATAYFLVTGKTPPEATELVVDPLVRPNNISDYLWKAIEASMRPSKNNRPHSITEYRHLIGKKEETAQQEVTLQKNPVDSDVTILDVSTQSSTNSVKQYVDIAVGNVTMRMIGVEGGCFQMGATQEQVGNAYPDENPAHKVKLRNYYIGETPVTRGLWNEVMGKTSDLGSMELPINEVSWDDCNTFIQKLKDRIGIDFRLPSEAEWEFAARGGNRSMGTIYAGSNDIEDVAWYSDNSKHALHPVKQKKPNELGIYDMNGNVKEWCQDWYDLYDSEAQENPVILIKPTSPISMTYCIPERVVRGGEWESTARSSRVSTRFSFKPNERKGSVGFRLVMDV